MTDAEPILIDSDDEGTSSRGVSSHHIHAASSSAPAQVTSRRRRQHARASNTSSSNTSSSRSPSSTAPLRRAASGQMSSNVKRRRLRQGGSRSSPHTLSTASSAATATNDDDDVQVLGVSPPVRHTSSSASRRAPSFHHAHASYLMSPFSSFGGADREPARVSALFRALMPSLSFMAPESQSMTPAKPKETKPTKKVEEANKKHNLTNEMSDEGGFKCAVCLDKPDKIMATTCGHVFCNQCICNAIQVTSQCPICRSRLTRKQIHPLYV